MGNNTSSQLADFCAEYHKDHSLTEDDLTDLLIKDISKIVNDLTFPRLAKIRDMFFIYKVKSRIEDDRINKIEELTLQLAKSKKPNRRNLWTETESKEIYLDQIPKVAKIDIDREDYSVFSNGRHIWIVQPKLHHLDKKFSSVICGEMTVEETEEVLTNFLERYKAKLEGNPGPPSLHSSTKVPKAILPCLIGDRCPTVIKIDELKYKEEYEILVNNGEASVIITELDCIWIFQPAIAYVNYKLKSRTNKNMTVEEVQELVNKFYLRLLEYERVYAEFKAH